MIAYLGEILSLAAPISWSFAVIVFRRTGERVPPVAFNMFKMVFALGLLSLTWMAMLQWAPADAVAHPNDARTLLILLGSGVMGIGVADTLYLMGLNRVGAALHAIVTTSYSPSVIGMSVLFLGERLTPIQAGGVVLILSAVLLVTSMRGPHHELDRRTLVIGTLFGVLSMLTQAISVVMMKAILDQLPLVWANCWRLAGGVASLGLLLPFLPREHRSGLRILRDRAVWPQMMLGAVLGNYVSLLLWLGGMKYTDASIAAALNQSATLWTFLLAALLLKEPVTWKRVLGLVVGMGGVVLVTFGG